METPSNVVENNKKICSRCKKKQSLTEFKSKTGREIKTCSSCRRKTQKCKEEGCKTQPTYGLPGSKKREYCVKHGKDREGYEDIANKRCVYPGCKTHPKYGLPGSKKREYCVKHGMDRDGYEDIASKRCEYPGCKTRANYGKLFTTVSHCFIHKTKNMYRTIHPKCEFPLCKSRPFYTPKGKIFPLRCEDHYLPDDSNVVERECSSCHLMEIISDELSFKGQCNVCNDFQEYNSRKEHIVMDILKLHDLEPDIRDKIYDSKCSKKRVDGIYDCKTHFILLEIDEHQHSSSKYDCERVRMKNLSQEFGGAPVIFVRFNPDSYRDQFEGYVAPNIEGRMFKLIETIRRMWDYKPSCLLSVVYLYYDLYVETGIPEVEKIEF